MRTMDFLIMILITFLFGLLLFPDFANLSTSLSAEINETSCQPDKQGLHIPMKAFIFCNSIKCDMECSITFPRRCSGIRIVSHARLQMQKNYNLFIGNLVINGKNHQIGPWYRYISLAPVDYTDTMTVNIKDWNRHWAEGSRNRLLDISCVPTDETHSSTATQKVDNTHYWLLIGKWLALVVFVVAVVVAVLVAVLRYKPWHKNINRSLSVPNNTDLYTESHGSERQSILESGDEPSPPNAYECMSMGPTNGESFHEISSQPSLYYDFKYIDDSSDSST